MNRILRRFAITAGLAAAFMAAGFDGSQAGVNFKPLVEVDTRVKAKKAPALKVVMNAGALAKSRKAAEFKRGSLVDFATAQPPGSIVVVTRAKRLYLVLGNGKAVEYQVATAKRGFEWSGTHKVAMKQEWPDWRPPAEMRERRPELPEFMAGGPDNPLGARALYLGSSIYRIHGTNEPDSIGTSASSGCIRMRNDDVVELYSHVKLGANVTVL